MGEKGRLVEGSRKGDQVYSLNSAECILSRMIIVYSIGSPLVLESTC